jgi:hypothetical protein
MIRYLFYGQLSWIKFNIEIHCAYWDGGWPPGYRVMPSLTSKASDLYGGKQHKAELAGRQSLGSGGCPLSQIDFAVKVRLRLAAIPWALDRLSVSSTTITRNCNRANLNHSPARYFATWVGFSESLLYSRCVVVVRFTDFLVRWKKTVQKVHRQVTKTGVTVPWLHACRRVT